MLLPLQAAAAMPDESERYSLIPARLEGRLMAFQREGVKFALRHGGRALIGDEMGLGKTVQVMHFSLALRQLTRAQDVPLYKELHRAHRAAEGLRWL